MPLYQSGAFPIPATGSLGWSDALFARDGANAIAQRNGTSGQTFNVYNTYTDSSNYERAAFDWNASANVLTIGAIAAGTGTLRSTRVVGQTVIFKAGGSDAWSVNSSGHLIGASAGVYVKTPGTVVASLTAAATAGAGARAFVTDASAPTFGATVAGGGAVNVPVYSDGTNWKVG